MDPEIIAKSPSNPESEAPLSTNVVGYYKGFRAQITIRKNDNTILPVSEITALIDRLEAAGFQPSWNSETNGKAKTEAPTKTRLCSEHQVEMPERIGKTSGKKYYSHSKQEDGVWVKCFGQGYRP